MSMKNKVIIVGGGAAGMVGAISARRMGADVLLLERNSRVGKKILATGNGRCNLTNMNAGAPFYNGKNPKFVYSVFSEFGVDKTLKFFEKLGIEYKVEEFGKVYPMSDQASSVLDVLLYELNHLGVEIVTDCLVTSVKKKGRNFFVETIEKKTYQSDKVIVTTGGNAMPLSGSDGNGYELLTALGHSVTEIFPALVQLMLEGKFFKSIDGVKFVGRAEILEEGKVIAEDTGDILFTNYGISGPPILQISRKAAEASVYHKNRELKIVILDKMDEEEIRRRLYRRFRFAGEKTVEQSLIGLINKRLISVILKECGVVDLRKKASTLSDKEKRNICRILGDWRFELKGTKGWQSAQVTAGGVNTKEIHQDTMQSKLVEGLFLAGEVVDIDGQCGGFNLQWAWSSGYVAGRSAALNL